MIGNTKFFKSLFVSMTFLFLLGSFTKGYSQVSDNLDSYPTGTLADPTGNWTVWPGGQMGEVSTDFAHSGSNSLKITGAPAGGPVDQLFNLGDETSGVWSLSYWMYVPTGNTAYYNLQHLEATGNWAFEAYFHSNATGTLSENGNTAFSYPQNSWFEVRQIIDQDNDLTKLYINNILVKTWTFSNGSITLNQIGAFDFFPTTYFSDVNPNATPLFYLDDLSLTNYEYVFNGLGVNPTDPSASDNWVDNFVPQTNDVDAKITILPLATLGGFGFAGSITNNGNISPGN